MRRALWVLGLVVVMLLIAPWDLALSQALHHPDSWLVALVTPYGEWPAWVLTASCLVVVLAGRRAGELRAPARATALLALAHPLLLTQSLKHFWGRVRFRDLSPDLVDFTPFYLPAGPGAGESFPSGHTAMAAVALPLALWLARRGGLYRGLALLPVIYVLLVAAGRVLAGAHYTTDVVFSVGVAALLTPLLLPASGVSQDRGSAGR